MTRQKALSSEVRKINRNLVFHYLYDHPCVTKQELAQALGMSMPTITQNLNELLSQGLINNEATLQSTGGRRARALSIRAEARYAVGLDVTAHHISGVVLDLAGTIAASRQVRAPFANNPVYFRGMAALIDEMLDDARVDRGALLGVGLSVPAIISRDGQRLTYAAVLNFTNGHLDDFAEFIPFPCRFVNDANAGGFAECWNNVNLRSADAGAGAAYLSLSNSVGGTFLLGGDIYAGRNQRASEFGHVTLVPNGRPCYCGQRGCADAYLSAGLLSGPFGGSLSAFFQALSQGDAQAAALWESYVDSLCLLINSLRMVFDCDIIVGGYVGAWMAPYLPDIRARLARRNPFDADGGYLKACAYQREAAAVGAALTFISELVRSV